MVIPGKTLETFEHELQRNEQLTIVQRYDLFEGMFELAKKFGHFNSDHLCDDMAHILHLAKIVNAGV
jgi:hypothetical protein